jgi:hypothetical protein
VMLELAVEMEEDGERIRRKRNRLRRREEK